MATGALHAARLMARLSRPRAGFGSRFLSSLPPGGRGRGGGGGWRPASERQRGLPRTTAMAEESVGGDGGAEGEEEDWEMPDISQLSEEELKELTAELGDELPGVGPDALKDLLAEATGAAEKGAREAEREGRGRKRETKRVETEAVAEEDEMKELLKHLSGREKKQVEEWMEKEAKSLNRRPSASLLDLPPGQTLDNEPDDASDDDMDETGLWVDEEEAGEEEEGEEEEMDEEDIVMEQRRQARERRRWLQRKRVVPYSQTAKGMVALPQGLRHKLQHVLHSLHSLPAPQAAHTPTRGPLPTDTSVTSRSGVSSLLAAKEEMSRGAPIASRKTQRQLVAKALHERMYAAPKEAEAIVKGTVQTERPQLVYSLAEAAAYLTDHFPGSFAALVRVLAEVEELLPEFTPNSALDFGFGPATSLLAADHLWGKNVVREMLAVEPSSAMTDVAQALTKWDARVTYRRYLARGKEAAGYDMVIASSSLNCVEDTRERRSVVRSLWRHVADGGVLVIVENGTPLGHELVQEARSVVLVDELVPGRVVGPCPHAMACPMAGSGRWCHFKHRSQNVMQSKRGVVQSHKDIPFSYVILQKQSAGVTEQAKPVGVEEEWGRLVQKPRKRGGHVLMDICTPKGTIEEVVVSKKLGKDWYSSARKARWGDGFILPPKHVSKSRKPRTFSKEYQKEAQARSKKTTEDEEYKKLFVDAGKLEKLHKKKEKRLQARHHDEE